MRYIFTILDSVVRRPCFRMDAATTTTRTTVLVLLLVTMMKMSSSSTSFSSAAIVATTTAITAPTHRARTMSSFVASSSLSSSSSFATQRIPRGREPPARTITAHALVAGSCWESVPSSFSSSSLFASSSLSPTSRNRRYRHHNRQPSSSFSFSSSSSSSSEIDEPTGDKETSTSSSSEGGGGRVPESYSIRRTLAKTPTHLAFEASSSNSNCADNAEPSHVYEWEQTIKKSRFIAIARSVTDWSDATAFLDRIQTQRHPKARHWCYAYRGTTAGTTLTERASDDGEPSGTAGQPILNALQTEGDLSDVMLIVIRYSGGIKLGTGGLIRAYGGTARKLLQTHREQQVDIIPKAAFRVQNVQPKYIGCLYAIAANEATSTLTAEADEYNTAFRFDCECAKTQDIQQQIVDATRGSITILPL